MGTTTLQSVLKCPNPNNHEMPAWLFVLWAGCTALIAYSLVYALRKPFTAAELQGMQICGINYKIAVSVMQLLGYVFAKLLGIKYISELKPERRLKFIIGSAALSEISLLFFGLLPANQRRIRPVGYIFRRAQICFPDPSFISPANSRKFTGNPDCLAIGEKTFEWYVERRPLFSRKTAVHGKRIQRAYGKAASALPYGWYCLLRKV